MKAISFRATFEDEDALLDVTDIEHLQSAMEESLGLALLEIVSRITVEVVAITEVSREAADLDVFDSDGVPRIYPFSPRRFDQGA